MADPGMPLYPWYATVSGPELEQGDLLLEVPILHISLAGLGANGEPTEIEFDTQHIIVMTQSCDLLKKPDGTYDIDQVLLCPVYERAELATHPKYGKAAGWNEARKGRHPGYHVLNRCDITGREFDYRLVDLRRAYSLPLALVQSYARNQGARIRLLPPYREHLAQAFARFFMRVGLPQDLPEIKF